jgi:hypothetical protein
MLLTSCILITTVYEEYIEPSDRDLMAMEGPRPESKLGVKIELHVETLRCHNLPEWILSAS